MVLFELKNVAGDRISWVLAPLSETGGVRLSDMVSLGNTPEEAGASLTEHLRRQNQQSGQ